MLAVAANLARQIYEYTTPREDPISDRKEAEQKSWNHNHDRYVKKKIKSKNNHTIKWVNHVFILHNNNDGKLFKKSAKKLSYKTLF